MMEMPPLPPPEAIANINGASVAVGFTPAQMREYGELCARMAREQERERCALIAQDMDYGLGDLAAEIRKG